MYIVHVPEKDWLVLIGAYTTHGPIDIIRHNELKELFGKSGHRLIFVTAFMNRNAMTKHISEIAWETGAWLVDSLTYMVHFNSMARDSRGLMNRRPFRTLLLEIKL